MSNLVDHVLMNKLDDELNKAINDVGGDTSSARGPWDYPQIIKEQLGSKNAAVDLVAGPGIVIREHKGKKFICGTSGALTTGALNPPAGSYKQPISEVIEAGTPIQEVFEALFYKILPRMSSVYKGDIIKSDKFGSDRYNEEDTRTGLVPESVYLRLYVANRQEPVYVLLSGHGVVNEEGLGDAGHQEYVGNESDYIKVSIVGNVITASINENGLNLMKQLSDKISNIEETVKEIESTSKELESKFIQYDAEFVAINAKLDTKANASEVNDVKNALSEKVSKSELNQVNSKINSINAELANVNSKINNHDAEFINVRNSISETEAIASRAESKALQATNTVNEIENRVEVTEQKITNVTQNITVVEQSVQNVTQEIANVGQNVTELQQTTVTKEEVNNIVEQEVTHVVNNTEVVDGKVKEQLISALGDSEDVEVQEALESAVNKVLEDNSVTDGSSIVDDIFAGL